jgi:hypothetical protein
MKTMRIMLVAFMFLSTTHLAYGWGIDNIKTWTSDRVTNVKNIGGGIKSWGSDRLTNVKNIGQGIGAKCDSLGDTWRNNAAQPGSSIGAKFLGSVGNRVVGAGAWAGKSVANPRYASGTAGSFFNNTVSTVKNWGANTINSIKDHFSKNTSPKWFGSENGGITKMEMRRGPITTTPPVTSTPAPTYQNYNGPIFKNPLKK